MSIRRISGLLFTIFGVNIVPITAINVNSVNTVGWENVFENNLSAILPLHHYGGKSYYMGFYYKLNYLQAYQFCQNIHMNLLSITTSEENNRIYKYVRNANKGTEYWTSGSRFLDGKHWVWMSNGELVGYTQWAKGEPNTNYEMCLQLYIHANKGIYWYDRDCNTLLFFICERKSSDSYDNAANPNQLGNTKWFQHSSLSVNINLMEFNNKSYYISRKYGGQFLEAVQFCKMIQMQLVTITSEQENTKLHKYIRDTSAGYNFWSSGTRFLDGESWIWISTGLPVEYTNWLQGQPDNKYDRCIQLVDQRNNGLFWNNANCELKFPFICETSSDIWYENVDGYFGTTGNNYEGGNMYPSTRMHIKKEFGNNGGSTYGSRGTGIYHKGLGATDNNDNSGDTYGNRSNLVGAESGTAGNPGGDLEKGESPTP